MVPIFVFFNMSLEYYGGQNGVYILPLLHRLEIPLVVTLHTILKTPTYNEKAVLQEIGKMAQKIVVMSQKAIEFLVDIYDVPREKIALIEHGVPDIKFSPAKSKEEFKLGSKKVLLTFGFIGRNKGIETVINALPDVIQRHPDVVYIILGKTHPKCIKAFRRRIPYFLNAAGEEPAIGKPGTVFKSIHRCSGFIQVSGGNRYLYHTLFE